MSLEKLDYQIYEQKKLLSWHLKNLGIERDPETPAVSSFFKALEFSPSLIDHTILKPQASQREIELHCEEALTHHFGAVCINPMYVSFVSRKLQKSNIKTVSVVGFPLGAVHTLHKVNETNMAISEGAEEIDMVLNIGKLRSKSYDEVFKDISEVVRAAQGFPVKVILETCLLNQLEKIQSCLLSLWAGASFVKTSTGFATGGANVEDITLMRKIVGPRMGIKASGGIKTFEDVQQMLKAGATRIGTSSGLSIIHQQEETKNERNPASELY